MAHTDSFLCFAHGGADGWEAICVDLDIAIEAETLAKAQAVLTDAIGDYVESAALERRIRL